MKNKYQKVSAIILCAVSLAHLNSCQEDTTTQAELATLTTVAITNITPTTAISGGTITNDGRNEVTARGVCWGTNPNPTVSDFKTEDGTGTGNFASSLTGLSENAIYHVRAYATNEVGTGYGDDISFTTANFTLPVLSTLPAASVGQTMASTGGVISGNGGTAITSRGVSWSMSRNPTISDNKTTDGSGTGNFTSNISGLTPNSTYYVRAYATNNTGTAYGEEIFFTTLERGNSGNKLSDVDGNTYNTVVIGTQIWMAENLKTTKYSDGTSIPLITDSLTWLNDKLGAYTWYHNDVTYKDVYGALYNWYAVNTAKLCPNGWHVPTDDEWISLENYLIANGYNYDGTSNGDRATNNKLSKALADVTTWGHSDNAGSPGNTDFANKRNASGFNAKAGGYKDFYGSFGFFTSDGLWHRYEGVDGAWWSSSELVAGAVSVWWREISTYQTGTQRSHNDKYYGLSVRCVKN